MNSFLKTIFFRGCSYLPRPKKLVMLDDSFPSMYVGYRVAEFNHYLEVFKNSEVYSVCPTFERSLKEYALLHPEFMKRIHRFSSRRIMFPSLFYVVFLTKAYAFLPYIERERQPFILNMYTEGGFGIDNPRSDAMIAKVFASPYLAHVVVSQKRTMDYLLTRGFCDRRKISFIYGAVPADLQFKVEPSRKEWYPQSKSSFDICFVANKYMKSGADKGFDTFIEACRQLQHLNNIHFHVIGDGFKRNDFLGIDREKLTYYGGTLFPKLVSLFSGMDCIISPTVPNTFSKGSFDGFPTGSCREAAYAGVAVFSSDVLKINSHFKDREDIVIIKPNAEDIVKKVVYYYNNPNKLQKLAEAGQVSFRRVFDFKTQMKKRVSIINKYL